MIREVESTLDILRDTKVLFRYNPAGWIDEWEHEDDAHGIYAFARDRGRLHDQCYDSLPAEFCSHSVLGRALEILARDDLVDKNEGFGVRTLEGVPYETLLERTKSLRERMPEITTGEHGDPMSVEFHEGICQYFSHHWDSSLVEIDVSLEDHTHFATTRYKRSKGRIDERRFDVGYQYFEAHFGYMLLTEGAYDGRPSFDEY